MRNFLSLFAVLVLIMAGRESSSGAVSAEDYVVYSVVLAHIPVSDGDLSQRLLIVQQVLGSPE